MQPVQKLDVWQEAMTLVEDIYRLTGQFPKEELFGLTSQLHRSAVSIPSNIAEGYGRSQLGEYLQHLSVSRGSLMELQTQLILSVRLGYLNKNQARTAWNRSESVGKMLTRLISSLREKSNPKPQAPSPKPRRRAA